MDSPSNNASPESFGQSVPELALSSETRRTLRAQAHGLSPVVMIGTNGLTDTVIQAIDAALTSHSLIKIRASHDQRSQREAWLAEICTHVGCAPVQHLGKLFIVYRPSPETPTEKDSENQEKSRPRKKTVRTRTATNGAKKPVNRRGVSTFREGTRKTPSPQSKLKIVARKKRSLV